MCLRKIRCLEIADCGLDMLFLHYIVEMRLLFCVPNALSGSIIHDQCNLRLLCLFDVTFVTDRKRQVSLMSDGPEQPFFRGLPPFNDWISARRRSRVRQEASPKVGQRANI